MQTKTMKLNVESLKPLSLENEYKYVIIKSNEDIYKIYLVISMN
jgi:hypothetical protein